MPILLYFKLASITFIGYRSFFYFSYYFKHVTMNQILILLFELFGILFIIKYVSKIRGARMLSGILIFVSTLGVILTSVGSGLFLYLLAISASLFISLSRFSKLLIILFLPLFCPHLYIRAVLHLVGMDTLANAIKMMDNNYIILFIYPAILLSLCDNNNFKPN